MVRRKFSSQEIALGAASVLVVLAILIFYIWYQTEAVRLGYEIGKQEEELLKLKDDIKKLEAQKAALLSPEKIEETARTRLNMTDPKEDQIIYEDEIF